MNQLTCWKIYSKKLLLLAMKHREEVNNSLLPVHETNCVITVCSVRLAFFIFSCFQSCTAVIRICQDLVCFYADNVILFALLSNKLILHWVRLGQLVRISASKYEATVYSWERFLIKVIYPWGPPGAPFGSPCTLK